MAGKGPRDQKYLLEQALEANWRKYSSRLRQCRRNLTAETLRRLRVAIRRLLSLLQTVQALAPNPAVAQAHARLKHQLKQLGPLRDLHMQVDYLQRHGDRFPGLKCVVVWLEKKSGKKKRRATRAIKHKLKLKQDLRVATLKAERFLVEEGARVEMRKKEILRRAFRNAENRFHALDPANVETIHRLRVGFKQFRYAREALLGSQAPGLSAMKKFQARMGEIQDADVVIGAVRKFCELHKKQRKAIRPVLRELIRHRAALIDSFWRHRNDFLRFAIRRSGKDAFALPVGRSKA